MIQRVYENARACTVLAETIVATDSSDIAKLVEQCGGKVALTSTPYATGSDRVAAVAKNYPEADIVVNLQGDEPFVSPAMLTTLVQPYLNGASPVMTTLVAPLDPAQRNNPDIVKVIANQNDEAIYFSRAPLPYLRTTPTLPLPLYHHMGIYAFRYDFLSQFTRLAQTPLEQAEALEQLRALENGYPIKLCLTEEQSLEVNTPADLLLAQNFLSTTKSTTDRASP